MNQQKELAAVMSAILVSALFSSALPLVDRSRMNEGRDFAGALKFQADAKEGADIREISARSPHMRAER